MFKTRKELNERIQLLERELSDERQKTRISSMIDTAKLPQCKGLYCRKCVYAVYSGPGGIAGDVLLGCGKDAGCDSFTPTQETKDCNQNTFNRYSF